ncbi:MAG: TonB-dependent receptor [Gammaproteobacteria bacterium]|nr:TonB-dependent receptor [Gammaproteobacteria bacterium]
MAGGKRHHYHCVQELIEFCRLTRIRCSSVRWRCVLLAVATLYPFAIAAQAPSKESDLPIIGEPLRQAIDRFDSLNVFSSTRLLPRRLLVTIQPDPSLPPRAQIQQLLDPHGLTLIMTSDAIGYIALQEQPPTEPTSPPNEIDRIEPYIEEIVVYAPVRVDRTDRRQTLTQQQLTQIPSLGRDTFRTLQTLPGIAADGVTAVHSVRGGDTNEILYRIDDIEQYKPFHFADLNGLFSSVNPHIIDSADIYISGFPSRFGTRMSGVVDMHLVEPSRPVQGTVDLSTMAFSADARGYSENWTWLTSGRVSLLGDILKWTRVSGEENLKIPRFDDELLRLQRSGTQDELTFGAYRSNETVDVERESIGERANAKVNHYDFWLRWLHEFSPDLQAVFQCSYFSADRSRMGTNEIGESKKGSLSETRSSAITTLTNRWRWTPSRTTEVQAGWSYLRHNADFDAALSIRYGPVGKPIQRAESESRRLILDRGGSSTHLFGSVTRALSQKLTATLGARVDRQKVAEVDSREISGRMAFSYRLSPEWQIEADIGRYKQPQFLHEIQIDEGRTELDDPQHADQINLGIGWTRASFTIGTDVFIRRIDQPWFRFDNLYNRFTLLPELGSDRYLIKAGQARSRGLEVAASYGSQSLSWKLTHVWLDSRERVGGTWHKRSWDQPRSFKAQASWSRNNWHVGGNLTYRTGWPITPLITDPTQLPQLLNTDRLPDFLSLELHFARTVQVRRGDLEIYGDITNLTDHRNLTGHLYDADFARRPAFGLPAIPAIGIRWTW